MKLKFISGKGKLSYKSFLCICSFISHTDTPYETETLMFLSLVFIYYSQVFFLNHQEVSHVLQSLDVKILASLYFVMCFELE